MRAGNIYTILDVGHMLVEAKRTLPHGEFEKMVDAELPFGARTGQMLMLVAGNKLLLNPNYSSLLRSPWQTLCALATT